MERESGIRKGAPRNRKFLGDKKTLIGSLVILSLLVVVILVSYLNIGIFRYVVQGICAILILGSFLVIFYQIRGFEEQSKGFVEEITDLNTRFGILADAINAVSSSLDLQDMASNILGVMLTLTGAGIGVIMMPDENKEYFEVLAQRGFREAALQGLRVPLERGSIGKVYRTGTPIIKERMPEEPKAAEIYVEGRSPVTQIIMPLRAKGETVGVAISATTQLHSYTQEEINLFSNLCHQMAVAIINVELYKQNKKTLEWLADSQEYTEHFIEEMTAGVLVLNEEGKVIHFNREAVAITGIEMKDVINAHYQEFTEAHSIYKNLAPFRNYLELCLTENKTFRRQEISYRKSGGKMAVISFNAFPLHRANGELLGASLIFMDITAVKEMEARLRQQDHLSILGQMSAKIAHEVKNPIFAILGLADELKEAEDEEERNRLIEMINKEANLCNQWISGMLTFSKAPAIIRDAKESSLDLKENLHHILVDFIRANGKPNLKVVEDFEESLPQVKISFDQLRHVFVNLFENAVHAMPDGGVLTVRARSTGNGYVEVRVEDTGIGISKEHLTSIFAPFFTTKDEGTGLGLAIVQKILLDIGGSIDVLSQENVGTAIIVKLQAV